MSASLDTQLRGRRFLIITGSLWFLPWHYEGVISALAAAGVDIRIRYVKQRKWITPEEYEAMLDEAGIDAVVSRVPESARDPDELLGLRLRELGNILRYSHADYEDCDALRERALEKASFGPERWGRRIMWLGSRVSSALARPIAWLEATLPASRSADALLDEERPHAIAVVAVNRAPMLVDYLKAAAERGIPSSIWIMSWDNLTNKGLLHFDPDRVFVWNKHQADELERYHGVSSDHICITGAQTFDHWFEDEPASEREEFCSRLGLDPSKPIILYLGSSKQIAPNETEFFMRWLQRIRSSDDATLRSSLVLVRPYPTLTQPWFEAGIDREPQVVISPSTSQGPLSDGDEFRREYRDELHHATVVVGVNTSGLIDAAIFGKPVCTVELPELHQGQRGTVHFQHLVDANGGLLRTATSFDEHATVLSELVRRDPYERDERSDQFVRAFVRPHGLDVAPTHVFFGETARLFREPSRVARPTGVRRVVGKLTARMAPFAGAPLEERPLVSVLAHLLASAIVIFVRLRYRLRGPVFSRRRRLLRRIRLVRKGAGASIG